MGQINALAEKTGSWSYSADATSGRFRKFDKFNFGR
jgi:hypothetical protein